MKASTCDLISLGARMKAAREAIGLSRPAFAEKFGGSVRTLENNEGGKNEPGACLIATFAAQGINANWLLTGEGPMLLADVQAKAPEPKINWQALAAILEGILKAGAPLDRALPGAWEFYQINIDRGLITPEGIGEGKSRAA